MRQPRGRRLWWLAHAPTTIGLQARIGGNALGSLPSLVRGTFVATRDLAVLFLTSSVRMLGLDEEREQSVQSGHSSRWRDAHPGRR